MRWQGGGKRETFVNENQNTVHMKTYLCALLLLFITGCEGGSTAPSARSTLSFSLASQPWEAEESPIIGISQVDGYEHLTITGRDPDFTGQISSFSLFLSVEGTLKAGTYYINKEDAGATVTKVDGKTYLVLGSSPQNFTLVVDEIQGKGKVRGSFSGTMTGPAPGDNIKILNGKFNSF